MQTLLFLTPAIPAWNYSAAVLFSPAVFVSWERLVTERRLCGGPPAAAGHRLVPGLCVLAAL